MIQFRTLEKEDYLVTYEAMKSFTANRTNTTVDEIWFLEHSPVYTLGTSATPSDLLNPQQIPCVNTDRGGQVTYHGPGQLMGYILLDLRRRQMKIRNLVHALENALIASLQDLSIQAHTVENQPGVYVNQRKIASLGLKIAHGLSYHGFSLNVNMDLTPFSGINPCGIKNLEVVNIADFTPITVEEMIPYCQAHLQHYLEMEL